MSNTTQPASTPSEASEPAKPLAMDMDGAVAILTMQHKPYNLLDKELSFELIKGLEWARQQRARAVVVRSGLRHFSAGADLDEMVEAARKSDVLDWQPVDVLRAFDEHPAPIVASVHGVCVGGGFEVALASDLVIAAQSAKIGSVEVTVGLHPLMGAVQRLTQRAGAARAKEMTLLGRRYDAATLERWNVINRVVPDEQLDTAALVLAQELAHGPSVANAATKQLVNIAVSDGVAAADDAMCDLQRPIFRSADFFSGVASYNENGVGMATFEGR